MGSARSDKYLGKLVLQSISDISSIYHLIKMQFKIRKPS